MMIAEKIHQIQDVLPQGVKLVVVSKFHPTDKILEVYRQGIRDFGENLAQEMLLKEKALPKDIRWHFIGRLQRNKVRQIIPFVSMIHSVDSELLYEEIVKRAAAVPRCVDILFQVHIAQEETKGGFSPEEAEEKILQLCCRSGDAPYRRVRGLMGMATNTDNLDQVRQEFAMLHRIFQDVKAKLPQEQGAEAFDTLSMGMSHDWKIAVEEGSSLIRVGSLIMGEREY